MRKHEFIVVLGEEIDNVVVLKDIGGGEPLVSTIKEDEVLLFLENLKDLEPLLVCWVDTGWVMAGGL